MFIPGIVIVEGTVYDSLSLFTPGIEIAEGAVMDSLSLSIPCIEIEEGTVYGQSVLVYTWHSNSRMQEQR